MYLPSDPKAGRFAYISLTLGILAFVAAMIPVVILISIRSGQGPNDDASAFSLGFLAVFVMLGGLILGVIGCLVGLAALRRNRASDQNEKTYRTAAAGLVLSVLAIATTVTLILFAVMNSSNTPPELTPPIPSTAVP